MSAKARWRKLFVATALTYIDGFNLYFGLRSKGLAIYEQREDR